MPGPGYRPGMAQEPAQPSELQLLNDRVTNLADRLQNDIGSLRDVLDRTLGGEPKEGQGGKPQPVPNGAIGDLNMRLDQLDALLNLLSHEVGRADRIA